MKEKQYFNIHILYDLECSEVCKKLQKRKADVVIVPNLKDIYKNDYFVESMP